MAQKCICECPEKHSLDVTCVLKPFDECCIQQQKESQRGPGTSRRQEEKRTEKCENLHKTMKVLLENKAHKLVVVKLTSDIPTLHRHKHIWLDSKSARIMKAQALRGNSMMG